MLVPSQRRDWISIVVIAAAVMTPGVAAAQDTTTAPPPAVVVSAPPQEPDPDRALVPSEPDFALAALPTTLRLARGKFVFRLTHRFTEPITEGSVGDFFANFFGLDSAARIGLEVRYGVLPGLQVVAHRTNDRSVQLVGQYQILGESIGDDVSIDVVAGADGQNNFSETFAGLVGAVVSKRLGSHGAIYVHPVFVLGSNPDPLASGDDESTAFVGVGARLRFGQTRGYVVVEAAPRVSGHRPGLDHVSVALEKRAGGHVFQINLSNGTATTLRQIALGSPSPSEWYIGFNLTRKFY
jgi:hypothetical protein